MSCGMIRCLGQSMRSTEPSPRTTSMRSCLPEPLVKTSCMRESYRDVRNPPAAAHLFHATVVALSSACAYSAVRVAARGDHDRLFSFSRMAGSQAGRGMAHAMRRGASAASHAGGFGDQDRRRLFAAET